MDHGVHPNFKVQLFLTNLIGELSIAFGAGFGVFLFVFLGEDNIDLRELLLGGSLLRLLLALCFFVFGAADTNLEVSLVVGRPRKLLVRDR